MLLIKKYPQAIRRVDSYGTTPYSIAKFMNTPDWVRRLLLRGAPSLDPDELIRFNYMERRMAIFLFFVAVSKNGGRMLFTRIRKASLSSNLIRRIVRFL
mmetsp:Transcript_4613/g.4739  ORF Transcript_4613/g.4739 Transcript_4613/m.4739 type:complete len:99 (+) Transcript_4613:23-319(+)